MKNFMVLLVGFVFVLSLLSAELNQRVAEQSTALAVLIKNNIRTEQNIGGKKAIVIDKFFNQNHSAHFEVTSQSNGKNIEIKIKDAEGIFYLYVNFDGSCELSKKQSNGEKEIAAYDPDYADDLKSSYNVEQITDLLGKYFAEIENYYNTNNFSN
jgi:hypothetical protein